MLLRTVGCAGLIAGSVLLCSAGCTPKEADKKTPPTQTQTKTSPASKPASGSATDQKKTEMAPVKLPDGDGPVAKVNGADISRDVFNREYLQTMERYRKARHDVKPALQERLKDNIVRRLVDAEIIKQQAQKMSITVDAQEVEKKWASHKQRYGSEEAFKTFLEKAGTTAEDVRRQFETNLLREKVFAKVSDSIKIDPKEVRKFYDDNAKKYDEPEQIKASHILIRVPPNANAEQRAEKKKKADEVLKLIKAKKGENFAQMAQTHGEDPTKNRGGDLGFFARGRMVKPFEAAAWPLKVGAVSDLVETQFGYHIIKKTDHRQARMRPFEEVKEQIERSVHARKRNETIRDALGTWKEQAKIEIIVKGDPNIINAPPARGTPQKLHRTPTPTPRPTTDSNVGKVSPKPETRTSPADH